MWDKYTHPSTSHRMGENAILFCHLNDLLSHHQHPLVRPSGLLSFGFNCRTFPNRNLPLSGIISLHWQNFSTWLEAHTMHNVSAAAGFIQLHSFSLLLSPPLSSSLLFTPRLLPERLVSRHISIYFRFFPLSLSTHLHAGLREIDFQRHFFAHEYIRVARFGKQRLQNVELCARKSSPLSSLLSRRRCRWKRKILFFFVP